MLTIISNCLMVYIIHCPHSILLYGWEKQSEPEEELTILFERSLELLLYLKFKNKVTNLKHEGLGCLDCF